MIANDNNMSNFLTDSGAPPGSSLWPPPLPGATQTPPHAAASPFPHNPLLSATHHHHAAAAAAAHAQAATLQQHQQHSIYLQHQQYQQQLQQQHQRRSGGPPILPLSQGKSKHGVTGLTGEPETITLSDDDDAQAPQNIPSDTEKNATFRNQENEDSKYKCSDVEAVRQSAKFEAIQKLDIEVKVPSDSNKHLGNSENKSDSITNNTDKGSTSNGINELSSFSPQISNEHLTPAKIKTERLSDFGSSLNGSNVLSGSSDHHDLNESIGIESKHQINHNGIDNVPLIGSANLYTDKKSDLAYGKGDIKTESDLMESSLFPSDGVKQENISSNGYSLLEEEASNPSIICAMTLLQLAESDSEFNIPPSNDFSSQISLNSDGLDILLAGIEIRTFEEMELLKNSNFGVDMLCSITRQDCYHMGIGDSCSEITIDDLCEVTKEDYFQFLYWIDPMVLLKHRYRIREYRSEARAMMCRNFISDKITAKKEETLLTLDENFQCPNAKIKSLDQVIRKIKNTEIMSQLEVSLREKIFQLQDIYNEKQKEVTRLKLTPKKVKKLKTKRQRGPGRPKKRILKSIKSKMGRPRKARESCESMVDEQKENVIEQLSDNGNEGEIDIVKIPYDDQNLPPPILEPYKTNGLKLKLSRKSTDSPPPPPLTPMMEAINDSSTKKLTSSTNSHLISNLLRPPKLTANSSPPIHKNESNKTTFSKNKSSVTNLSTINEKFMKGKANPFANLLTKLATKPSSAQNGSDEKEGDEESSPSEVDDDDKDKESQTDDGDEIVDKSEQEIESTSTTEEEDDNTKLKRNKKPSILDIKKEDESEEDDKLFSYHKKSGKAPSCKNSQVQSEKSNLATKSKHIKNIEKQCFPIHDHHLDVTTEHSSEQNVSSDFEDSYSNSAQKKRKSDKPKKHFGSTNEVETIVPKKPKNLFMMNCLKMQQNQRNDMPTQNPNCKKTFIKKDEYDFTDEDDEDHDIIKIGKRRKLDTAPGETNASALSPPTLPMENNATSQTNTSASTRINSSTTASPSHTSRQHGSHNPSPLKEKPVSQKHPARPRSAASSPNFGSLKNFEISSVRGRVNIARSFIPQLLIATL